jgi:hypothetical protein
MCSESAVGCAATSLVRVALTQEGAAERLQRPTALAVFTAVFHLRIYAYEGLFIGGICSKSVSVA